MDERDRDLLGAIVASARSARSYADQQGDEWYQDAKTVDAVAKRVEEVGELAKRVSAEVLAAIPGVDWKGSKAFREVLAHAYGQVDVGVLADVVGRKLPPLIEAVQAALQAEPEGRS